MFKMAAVFEGLKLFYRKKKKKAEETPLGHQNTLKEEWSTLRENASRVEPHRVIL